MSNPELELDHYDVIVIGTGLAESIAAASLAKAGKSVLHLDPNEYYGGEQASLTLDELVEWSNSQSSSTSSSSSSWNVKYGSTSTTPLDESLQNDRRRYALSLFPAILPSRGDLIDTLISSDVSKYVSFRILDSISLYTSEGEFKKVPGSKEEIFKDKTISLMDKRKLMKFLLFAASEFEESEILKGKESQPLIQFLQESFSLPTPLSESIIYAISHCSSPTEPNLPALKRTRRYLKSIGRYGNNAFLVGQYGGAGEIAQGFCRACAVFGGTYILGPSAKPTSLSTSSEGVTLDIPCHPRPVTGRYLISSPNHIPQILFGTTPSGDPDEGHHIAHCIAVTRTLPEALRRKPISSQETIEQEQEQEQVENDDTSLIVFPTENGGVVRCYVNGEGTGSCPPGQYIIYLSTSISPTFTTSPSEMLKPYLAKITHDSVFTAYYVSSRPSSASIPASVSDKIIVLKPYAGSELVTGGLDWEARQGEVAYRAVMGEGGKGFFEKDITEEEEMGIEDDM
ncbi:rab escort protein [Kwoniella mangroviensis CBS 10435]|uniref:Rab proteins geranylgeranyltransferase n=1 Tax=Kwoniella mangroviensis CBS 10435 TaxID=1331196 RepID=A0A1B9IQY3_9TREE|nr:rab escort protein [Kwoniella mangroviensis CBS 8507]OCF57948.1 rab escort protein [Kwoniella mangroviensis CBS 10435]OCF68274.1 rab escort protein [Kwoniella mangroviensis CBS 8507]OCF74950.1 rab escort protein [Kwoniella mangroviensis CBS 8886]